MAVLPDPDLMLRDFDGIPVWTDERLFEACGVRIAFTTRAGGASADPYRSLNLGGHVGDDRSCVVRNRELLLEALGGAGCVLVVPKQVHGTEILLADGNHPIASERQDIVEVDSVVVVQPGCAVQLSFADCLPVILSAPSGAFAVAHAGWRGALGGIAGKTLKALADASGCEPSDVNAYIGPYIHAECFETSAEIARSFADAYGEDVLADARHVDLARVVTTDLVRAGLRPGAVADCGICTVCHADEYFSYRASGGTCGRIGALAFRV